MRKISILIMILAIIGCNRNPGLTNKQSSYPYFVDLIKEKTPGLLEEIALDTLKSKDDKYEIEIEIVIPTCSLDTALNRIISDSLIKQKKEFENSVFNMIEADSTMLQAIGSFYSSNPISIFLDSNLISICISTYHYLAGAPHGKTTFESFTFDRKKRVLVNFSDYFIFDTKTDSSTFIKRINEGINKEGIGINKVHNIDFSLEKDSISFNFDDYEIASYAEGLIKGKVSKKSLSGLINKSYYSQDQ